jgi:7-cyano-7-deazaguanine synthase
MLLRMNRESARSVALVSGGLDSVVSLARAREETDVRLVLFADYGQRAAARERAAVVGIATFYGLPYGEVDLGWMRGLSPEGMRSLPGGRSGGGEPPRLQTFDDAAAFAENYRCDLVVTGFNREEGAEFPDNRAEYVEAVNRSFEYSTRNRVRVVSYTQDLDKTGILALGVELGAPLSLVWSCYDAGEKMCGRCASCRRLKAALAALPANKRPVIEFAE